MAQESRNGGGAAASSSSSSSSSPSSCDLSSEQWNLIIKRADMKDDMQKEAIAFEKHCVQKDIAENIKEEFDKKHGSTWHCIVGRNFDVYMHQIVVHFFTCIRRNPNPNPQPPAAAPPVAGDLEAPSTTAEEPAPTGDLKGGAPAKEPTPAAGCLS